MRVIAAVQRKGREQVLETEGEIYDEILVPDLHQGYQ
jgi:hypothetical protein